MDSCLQRLQGLVIPLMKGYFLSVSTQALSCQCEVPKPIVTVSVKVAVDLHILDDVVQSCPDAFLERLEDHLGDYQLDVPVVGPLALAAVKIEVPPCCVD